MLDKLEGGKRLLTIADFISEYGPCRTVVYELIGSGELKAVKLGKRTYITREAADQWVTTLAEYVPGTRYVKRKRRFG